MFSIDYWFCQREATKKRLVTVVPAPIHDSGFAVSVPTGRRQKRALQLPA